MYNFVELEDITDRVLNVSFEDISSANQFVNELAVRLGVNHVMIASFRAKRLGIIYACYACCLRSVGTDGSSVFAGDRQIDIFAQKLKFYREELNVLRNEITAADFVENGNNICQIKLGRA